MKRFLLIASALFVLIFALKLAPNEWYLAITELPMHPLIVHMTVVFGILGPIWLTVSVFLKNRTELFAYVTLFVAAATFKVAVLAEQTGEALMEVQSVSGDHVAAGERVALMALTLYVVTAVYLALRTYTDRVLWQRISAGLVIFMSIGVVGMTIAAGHSGAESVWGSTIASSESDDDSDDSDDASDSDSDSDEPVSTNNPDEPVASAYTFEEVTKHNTSDSCWAAIDGGVYDLTKWISQHPGGAREIEQICGTDATDAFANEHGGENEAARELSAFRIADLML